MTWKDEDVGNFVPPTDYSAHPQKYQAPESSAPKPAASEQKLDNGHATEV